MLMMLGAGFEIVVNDDAGGWLRDCWIVGLLMLMMLGAAFGIPEKKGC